MKKICVLILLVLSFNLNSGSFEFYSKPGLKADYGSADGEVTVSANLIVDFFYKNGTDIYYHNSSNSKNLGVRRYFKVTNTFTSSNLEFKHNLNFSNSSTVVKVNEWVLSSGYSPTLYNSGIYNLTADGDSYLQIVAAGRQYGGSWYDRRWSDDNVFTSSVYRLICDNSKPKITDFDVNNTSNVNLFNGDNYYFRPDSVVGFTWTSNDSGSGVSKTEFFKDSSIIATKGLTGSKDIPIDNANYQFKVKVTDKVNNINGSRTLSFFPDDEPPGIESQTIQYGMESNDYKLTYGHNFNIYDTKSGLSSLSSSNISGSGGLEFSNQKVTADGGFSRDGKYNFSLVGIKDNVGNIAPNYGPITFGLTALPDVVTHETIGGESVPATQFIYENDENGNEKLYTEYTLNLGELYDDPEIGIESLLFTFKNEAGITVSKPLTLSEMKSLNTIADSTLIEQPIGDNGDTIDLRPVNFKIDVTDLSLDPHETYACDIKTTYKPKNKVLVNEVLEDQALTENLAETFDLDVPNRPLSSSNNFGLDFIRFFADGITEQDRFDLHFEDMGTLESSRELFFNNNYQLVLNTTKDVDNDGLSLQVTYADDINPVTYDDILDGKIAIPITDRPISSISILENIQGVSESSDLHMAFTQFNDPMENLTVDSSMNINPDDDGQDVYYISQDSSEYHWIVEPGVYLDDIDQIVLFEYDDAVSTDLTGGLNSENYRQLVSAGELLSDPVEINTQELGFYQSTAPESGSTIFVVDQSLSDLPVGTTDLRNLGLRIRNKGGNECFFPSLVQYDDEKPSGDILNEADNGIISYYAPESSESPALYFSGYDSETRTVNLKFDDSTYTDLKSLSISESSDQITSVYNVNSLFSFILDSNYQPNTEVPITVDLTDYAGNLQTVNLSFYTPNKVLNSQTDYFSTITSTWTDNGTTPQNVDEGIIPEADDYHYVEFVKQSSDFDNLSLFNVDHNVLVSEITDGSAYIDSYTTNPHESRHYELRAFNDSGYLSTFPGSYLSITVPEANIDPVVYDWSISGSDGYFGPDSFLSVNYLDPDGDDIDVNFTIEENYIPVAEDVKFNIAGTKGYRNEQINFFSSEGAELYGFTDTETYDFTIDLVDRWEVTDPDTNEIISLSGTTQTKTESVVYDSSKPQISYDLGILSGYSYKKDNLDILSFSDTGSGLASGRYEIVAKDGSVISSGDVLVNDSVITGILIPDGRDIHIRFVDIEDKVGNRISAETPLFSKDSSAPSLFSPEVDSSFLNSGKYYFSNPQVPVTFNWNDTGSGLSKVLYRVETGLNEVKVGEVNVSSDKCDSEITTTILCDLDGLEANDSYSLSIRIADHAGNVSGDWTTVAADNLVLDFTPPVIGIAAGNNVRTRNGVNYIASNAQVFDLLENASDEYTLEYHLKYKEDGLDDENTFESKSEVLNAITNTRDYYSVIVLATDNAGNSGESTPFHFRYDNTIPVVNSFSYSPQDSVGVETELSEGAQVRFSVDADDTGSGIKKIYLYAGNSDSGTFQPELSSRMTGSLPDGSISFDYREGKIYSLNIPDCRGIEGSHFLKFSVEDAAGNRSVPEVLTGNSLRVRSGAYLTVSDYSLYSNDTGKLQASWTYSGTETVSVYDYKVVSEGIDVTTLISGTESFASIDGVYENGKTYKVAVKAVFEDGSETDYSYSPGCTIDTTAPVISSATLPTYGSWGDFTLGWETSGNDIDQLEALVWAYEYENGILKTDDRGMGVQSILGTYELEPLESEARLDLDTTLQNGQKIFVRLTARDHAGNLSQFDATTFILDYEAPPAAEFTINVDYLNPDKNKLTFDWSKTPDDGESKTVGYKYQLLKAGYSVSEADWSTESFATDTDTIISFETLSDEEYPDGTQVQLAVRSENGAGLVSIGYSNGVILDRSSPATTEAELRSRNHTASYLDGTTDNVSLYMRSLDEHSGIDGFTVEGGKIVEGEWTSLGKDIVTITENILIEMSGDNKYYYTTHSLPAGYFGVLDEEDEVSFRVTAFNNTGDYSAGGYTNSAIYFKTASRIRNLAGTNTGGSLQFDWNIEEKIPLTDVSVTLKKGDLSVSGYTNIVISPEQTSYVVDGSQIDDGFYHLEIETLAGTLAGETTQSQVVALDREAPLLDDLTYDRYVSEELTHRMRILDNLSGSAGFFFTLGIPGNETALKEGNWEWVSSTGVLKDYDVDLKPLNLPDDGKITFSMQVLDQAGNKSGVMKSDIIIADHTAPSKPELSRDHIVELLLEGDDVPTSIILENITTDDYIDHLVIEGEDQQSGIDGYEYAIKRSDLDDSVDNLVFSSPVNLSDEIAGLSIIAGGQTFYSDANFENGYTYNLYVRVRNRAGLLSEPSVCLSLLVDYDAPTLEFDSSVEGIAGIDNPDIFVFNDQVQLEIFNIDDAGKYVTITYSLKHDNGFETASVSESYLREGLSRITIPFSPQLVPDILYGNYTLHLIAEDEGGHSKEYNQIIRLNSPPIINPQPVSSTPGKTFSLPLSEDWILDQDGIRAYSVEIHDGNNIVQNIAVGEDYTNLIFSHNDQIIGNTSSYIYTVRAEDLLGQTSSAEGVFYINNTSEGPLYSDETWTSTHSITGKVTVGTDRVLTIENDALIQAVLDDETDLPEIVIESDGTLLISGNSVTMELYDRDMKTNWEGLTIKGDVSSGTGYENMLKGLTIRDARRGLTLDSTSVLAVDSCVFEDNFIGLHLPGTSPAVTYNNFIGNKAYGIKEDNSSDPDVTNNEFENNTFDYYDLSQTVLDAVGINNLKTANDYNINIETQGITE